LKNPVDSLEIREVSPECTSNVRWKDVQKGYVLSLVQQTEGVTE